MVAECSSMLPSKKCDVYWLLMHWAQKSLDCTLIIGWILQLRLELLSWLPNVPVRKVSLENCSRWPRERRSGTVEWHWSLDLHNLALHNAQLLFLFAMLTDCNSFRKKKSTLLTLFKSCFLGLLVYTPAYSACLAAHLHYVSKLFQFSTVCLFFFNMIKRICLP